MYKSDICDTKPAISMKGSSLEPKLLYTQSVCRNSCTTYRLMTNLMTEGELWPTFPPSKFIRNGYLSHFLSERNEIRPCYGVWPIETYSQNFVNFGPGVP